MVWEEGAHAALVAATVTRFNGSLRTDHRRRELFSSFDSTAALSSSADLDFGFFFFFVGGRRQRQHQQQKQQRTKHGRDVPDVSQ